MLDNDLIRLIKENSEDDVDYYFNIIRIYYYNFYYYYKKYNEDLTKKRNTKDEKENEKENEDKKENENEDKKENENEDVKENEDKKEKENENEDKNEDKKEKENENEDKNEDKKENEKENKDKKEENRLNIFNENDENDENCKNKNSKYHFDAEKFMKDIDIKYKSNLQKKLYKYIILKTHPDKTDDKFLNYLFIDSTFLFEENDIAILFIIAISLGYKCKKLSKIDKKQFEQNITKYIMKKKTYL